MIVVEIAFVVAALTVVVGTVSVLICVDVCVFVSAISDSI
jgi:hypothetical protein